MSYSEYSKTNRTEKGCVTDQVEGADKSPGGEAADRANCGVGDAALAHPPVYIIRGHGVVNELTNILTKEHNLKVIIVEMKAFFFRFNCLDCKF